MGAIPHGEPGYRHSGGTVWITPHATATVAHNGPVCSICHRGYVGTHTCSSADLQRLIDGLQVYLDQARRAGR